MDSEKCTSIKFTRRSSTAAAAALPRAHDPRGEEQTREERQLSDRRYIRSYAKAKQKAEAVQQLSRRPCACGARDATRALP